MPVDPVKNSILLHRLVDQLKTDALQIRCMSGVLTALDHAHPEYNIRAKLVALSKEPQVSESIEAQFRPLLEAARLAADNALLELLDKLPRQEFEN